MKYPMSKDKYFVYCPAISDKVLKKLVESRPQNHEPVEFPQNLVQIYSTAPLQARKALEHLAFNFKRENTYDFPQYLASEAVDERLLGAFIWTEKCMNNDLVGNRAIGGVCFRYRTHYGGKQQQLNGWALQWVYIHPNHRRKKLLTNAWQFFLKRFGDFVVEPEFSLPMLQFLAKNSFPCKIQEEFYLASLGPTGLMYKAINSVLVSNSRSRMSL